jgi:hypothetical protein
MVAMKAATSVEPMVSMMTVEMAASLVDQKADKMVVK